MTAAVRITSWRPARRGSILGYARAQYASGVIICEITIIKTPPHGLWAAAPTKPRVSKDGVVRRDGNGKVQHVTLIDFATSELKHRWSAEIIAAMHADYPGFHSDDEPAIGAVQEDL
jgi:hypothetical protein